MEEPRSNYISPSQRRYPVFEYAASPKSEPIFDVDRDRRQEMLDKGLAISISHGKALRLTKRKFDFRGLSCQPGSRSIHAYAEAKCSGLSGGSVAIIEDRTGWARHGRAR